MSSSDATGGETPDATAAELRASRAGLCDTCEHQQLVRNTRGSTFSLCRRSREDPDYPRYPRIPVLDCPGYGRREQQPDKA
jgi:hypothetical protein